VLASLRGLEAELNADPPPPYDGVEHPINLNVGRVSAGDWTSTVTAECTLSCRIAMYPGEDPAELKRRVEETVAPYEVRYDGFVCEGSIVPADEAVVIALGDAYARGAAGAAGDDGDHGRAALRASRDPGGLLRAAGGGDPRDRRARLTALDERRRARARALRPRLVRGESNRRRGTWP
jgi:hypothetical protein